MPEYLTLSEVADCLRVTHKTIYRLISKRAIPATRVGKSWRFEKAAIDEWLRSRSTDRKVSILVVDDDEAIRSLFKDTLEELNYTVTVSGTASRVLELVQGDHFDLAFIDLKMPGMDGADLIRQIKILKPSLPVTVITGYPDSEIMARALAHGPLGIMNKPFSASDIVTAVNNYLRFGMSAK